MRSLSGLMCLAASLPAIISTAAAINQGWSPSSKTNLALYWGADGDLSLSAYCSNRAKYGNFNVALVGFLTGIATPTLNIAGNQLKAADLQTCHENGVNVLVSMGGPTGITDTKVNASMAQGIWDYIGPDKADNMSPTRLWGTESFDGIDIDTKTTYLGKGLIEFASALRLLMDDATEKTGKTYYMTAAPQCPKRDADITDLISKVSLDWINLQFFDNYCNANTELYNYANWDEWIKDDAKNSDMKVLVGLPASSTAANSGYIASSYQLTSVFRTTEAFSSFAGAMLWDTLHLHGNPSYGSTVEAALEDAALTGN